MVLSSSVTNAAPSLDWADDTDDEIDFGAPVFSDDEDIAVSVRESVDTTVSTSSTSAHDYSARGSSVVDDNGPQRHPTHHHAPYREPSSSSNNNRNNSNNGRTFNSNQQYGRSFEKENHWKSGGRRDRTDGTSTPTGSNSKWGGSRDDRGPGSRSTRPVIPLPPKPAAALAVNHSPRLSQSRSRSPSYRALSPHSGFDRTRESAFNNNQSLSPHTASPLSGLSTRSFSPSRSSRTYMDQVTSTKEHSRRRSKDSAQESRWEKVPHEDKPYPTLHSSAASGSPKDDTIYFRRRNNQPSEPDPQDHHDRTNTRTMYHERLEAKNKWNRGLARNKESNERWEKAAIAEPDLPYPERLSTKAHHNNNSSSSGIDNNNSNNIKGHSRSRSRGQAEPAPVAPSPSSEKTNPRGTRGKGKDQHKQKSKAQAVVAEDDKDSDAGTKVHWWEQSTYGVKSNKKEDTVKEPKEELPWWEQSTYKLTPKQDSAEQVSSQLADMDLQKTKGSELSPQNPVNRGKADADTMYESWVHGTYLRVPNLARSDSVLRLVRG
ncbi:hypothetical protein BGZ50_002894 [Haplosporangium sp. Z 11]|nr:hypothetical protein BGZ50_002894 [Haplosporangium sp. Z 11]